MKLIFFGDSITSAERTRDENHFLIKYGFGYVAQIAGKLQIENPLKYEIINRGVGGHKSVDLYARIKKDVWNENPDVLTVLVGINDVAMDALFNSGVDIVRYEKIYRLIIEETKRRLPKTQLILMESFVLPGSMSNQNYAGFLKVKEYAKVVKSLAEEYGLPFIPLQEDFDKAYEQYGEGVFLADGVHPTLAGASLIANKWYKLFKEKIEKNLQ